MKSLSYVGFLAAFLLVDPLAEAAARELSIDARVACMQKIEQIYASHRTVPAGSVASTQTFNTDAARIRIEDSLRQSAILKSVWGRPVTAEAIAAEITRIERNTHDPERLRELYAALNNDPVLVGECLVRPELTDRMIRSNYGQDRAIHEATRTEAEVAKVYLQSGTTPWVPSHARRSTLRAMKLTPAELKKYFPAIDLISGESVESTLRQMRGQTGAIVESRYGYDLWRVTGDGQVESWHWDKVPFETWWQSIVPVPEQSVSLEVIAPAAKTNLSLVTTASTCEIGSWSPMENLDDFAPKEQFDSVSVWDGSEMLAYGPPSVGNEYQNPGRPSGVIYNPATDSWRSMSHTTLLDMPAMFDGWPTSDPGYYDGAWSGTEFLLWGACETVDQPQIYGGPYSVCFPVGGRYNPSTNTWQSISATDAPQPGAYRGLVWTGSRLFTAGGAYDPQTNAWSPIPSPPYPVNSDAFRSIWTGTEVVVFSPSGYAAYKPATNTWRLLSPTGAPPQNSFHVYWRGSATWTGSEALVMTDYSPPPLYTSFIVALYRYNPISDSWSQATTSGMPSHRTDALMIWAGDRLVIWGGYDVESGNGYTNTGAIYFPSSDTWVPIKTQGAPNDHDAPLGVWTGQEVLFWGGQCVDSTCMATPGTAPWVGGRLNVASNSWTLMSDPGDDGAPTARYDMGYAGDASLGYLWGGYNSSIGNLSDGSIYDPTLNLWRYVSLAGAPTPRWVPVVGLAGDTMAVFSGLGDGGDQPNGGIYNLQTDQWSSISTPPWTASRTAYTVGYSGSRLVVWGGWDSINTSGNNTGYILDLGSNQWTTTSTTGAPTARNGAIAVEHSGLLYVYGGSGVSGPIFDGGIFDASSNAWAPLSQSGDIPDAAINQSESVPDAALVDLGNYLLLWVTSAQQAWTYNLSTGAWHRSTMSGYVPTYSGWVPSIVWDGKEALYFGGDTQGASWIPNGWGYNPATDSWRSLETLGSPDGRTGNASFMVGPYMGIWGGTQSVSGFTSAAYTGGLYCPDIRTGPQLAELEAYASFDHPTFGYPGAPNNLRAYVYNGGPDTATQVHINVDTGADLAFEGVEAPPTASCTTPAVGTNGVIDCSLGTLDAGLLQLVEIQMSPYALGTFSTIETVTANETNPYPPYSQYTAHVKIITATDYVFSAGF